MLQASLDQIIIIIIIIIIIPLIIITTICALHPTHYALSYHAWSQAKPQLLDLARGVVPKSFHGAPGGLLVCLTSFSVGNVWCINMRVRKFQYLGVGPARLGCLVWEVSLYRVDSCSTVMCWKHGLHTKAPVSSTGVDMRVSA